MTHATGMILTTASAAAMVLCGLLRAADSTTQPQVRKVKVLMLGDSLTRYGLAPASEKELNALSAGAVQWTAVDAGVGGEAAEGGKARIAALLKRENPDIITVEYGANDIAKRYKPEQFRSHMEGIIQIIQSHSPAPRVVLMTVTPVDANRHSFGRDKSLMARGGPDWVLETEYNAVTRRLAAEKGLPLVDLHRHFCTAKDPMQLLVKDGIHLTPQAYKFIGAHLAKALLGYCQAEVFSEPEAAKARAAALTKLAEIRKQLEKGGDAKAQGRALEEVWQACPYLAEAAVVWHQATYPSPGRPATGRESSP